MRKQYNEQSNFGDLQISKDMSTKMKGLSISFIVIGHIINFCFRNYTISLGEILGTGGVWIFLVLSGYGLYCSYDANGIDTRRFWSSKINKLFIPYISITFIYYIWMRAWRIGGQEIGATTLLKNFLCIDFARNIDETMWYMSYLLIWYILFWAVFYFDFPRIIKIFILFACAYLFEKSMWPIDFAECDWQFATKAYAFPLGILLAYLLCHMNKYPLKIRNFKYIVLAVSGTLYTCDIFNVITLNYG